MSRFNTATKGTSTTENLAHGKAYKVTPEYELASILLTSFAQDSYYRSADNTLARLKELIAKCDPEFVAKAAVFARTKFGMRSITHVTAAELAKHATGKDWAKNFYDRIVYRPDDMLEIIACYKASNGKDKMLSNAMIKGFKQAFGRFDGYSIAKYRGEGKEFKLIDVVNLVRPIPNEKNAVALQALVEGKLISTETWEALLTEAGKQAENESEKLELKKEAWTKLLKEKKIKAFALLRNMRNILEQAPECVDLACEMLVDEKAIKKSLILPFRYVTAYNELEKIGSKFTGERQALKAVSDAMDISLNNVPKLKGNSLVVVDASSSMDDQVTGRGNTRNQDGGITRRGIGALFASIMAKANNADIMIFGTYATYVPYNLGNSTMTITKQIIGYNTRGGDGSFNVGHGTNFNEIFREANKKYDRIIIFSDCQGWMEGGAPMAEEADYRKRMDANPYIYSVDLAGYGSMMFPASRTFAVSGFSDKILTIMSMFEQDRDAFIGEILKTEL